MPISSISMKEIPIKKIAVAVTLSVLLTSCGASKTPEATQKEATEQSVKTSPEAKVSSEKGAAENKAGEIQLSAEEIQQSGLTVTTIQPEKVSD